MKLIIKRKSKRNYIKLNSILLTSRNIFYDIAQKKEPITANNKIQNLYSEIIQIEASKIN